MNMHMNIDPVTSKLICQKGFVQNNFINYHYYYSIASYYEYLCLPEPENNNKNACR